MGNSPLSINRKRKESCFHCPPPPPLRGTLSFQEREYGNLFGSRSHLRGSMRNKEPEGTAATRSCQYFLHPPTPSSIRGRGGKNPGGPPHSHLAFGRKTSPLTPLPPHRTPTGRGGTNIGGPPPPAFVPLWRDYGRA